MKDLSYRAACQLWCVCDCFCGSGWILICNEILQTRCERKLSDCICLRAGITNAAS